jgi:hypothetical protein
MVLWPCAPQATRGNVEQMSLRLRTGKKTIFFSLLGVSLHDVVSFDNTIRYINPHDSCTYMMICIIEFGYVEKEILVFLY